MGSEVVHRHFDALPFLQLPENGDEKLEVEGVGMIEVVLVLGSQLLLLLVQHLEEEEEEEGQEEGQEEEEEQEDLSLRKDDFFSPNQAAAQNQCNFPGFSRLNVSGYHGDLLCA